MPYRMLSGMAVLLVLISDLPQMDTRFVCEVIQGDNKGKKIKVKAINLQEIKSPSSERISVMKDELSKLREEFKVVQDAPRGKKRRDIIIKGIYNKVKDMIAEVPNCCMLWDSLGKVCKFLNIFQSMLY